jgi:hypothetical protein
MARRILLIPKTKKAKEFAKEFSANEFVFKKDELFYHKKFLWGKRSSMGFTNRDWKSLNIEINNIGLIYYFKIDKWITPDEYVRFYLNNLQFNKKEIL